jgi:dTMP kinase
LPLLEVRAIIDFAVGATVPDLTLLLRVSLECSEERRRQRQANLPHLRDRMEEADRAFFGRVAAGYEALALEQPHRIKVVEAEKPAAKVHDQIWEFVQQRLACP